MFLYASFSAGVDLAPHLWAFATYETHDPGGKVNHNVPLHVRDVPLYVCVYVPLYVCGLCVRVGVGDHSKKPPTTGHLATITPTT